VAFHRVLDALFVMAPSEPFPHRCGVETGLSLMLPFAASGWRQIHVLFCNTVGTLISFACDDF